MIDHAKKYEARIKKGPGRRAGVLLEDPSENEPEEEKGRILLVDDDVLVQKLGSLLLRRMGFEVESAGNGQAAMEIFSRERGAFQCVILDLVMPVMDGAATLEAIRSAAPHMPVIMCSAYDLEEVSRMCALDSWTSVVEKPFEFAALRAAVLAAVGSE